LSRRIAALVKSSPVMLLSWALVAVAAYRIATLDPLDHVVRYGIADALAYSRIAFNIAHGRGSTYGLLVPTNGYHPLWLALQIPFMWGAPSLLARLPLVIGFGGAVTVLATFSWSLLIRVLTGNDRSAALTALLFGLFGWSLSVLYSGIEVPLVLLVLALVYGWAFAVRRRPAAARPWLQLAIYGALCALSILARLDSVFLLVPSLVVVAPALRRCTIGQRAIAASVFAALLLPYFAWNAAVFGSFVPVSGMVKSIPDPSLARSYEMVAGWSRKMDAIGVSARWVYLGLSLGLLASPLFFSNLKRRSADVFRLVALLSVGASAHYAYALLFMREINVAWHVYPLLLAAYLMLATFLDLLEAGLRRLGSKLVVVGARLALLCLFVAPLALLTVEYRRAKQVRMVELAAEIELSRWISGNISKDARVAMYDSFLLSLFNPDLVLVDLNGLVEDRAGARLAKAGAFDQLIALRGCTHLIERWRPPVESAEAGEPSARGLIKVFPYRESGTTRYFTVKKL
jgi:hypothetical protein